MEAFDCSYMHASRSLNILIMHRHQSWKSYNAYQDLRRLGLPGIRQIVELEASLPKIVFFQRLVDCMHSRRISEEPYSDDSDDICSTISLNYGYMTGDCDVLQLLAGRRGA